MILLVISDIDDYNWTHGTGQADVLVACGDVYDQVILQAAKAYGCQTILAVKGNHDPSAAFPAPILDCHLRVHEINGVRFGGLNGSWKYKPRGHFLYEQNEVSDMLAGFAPVDIFISHNSPRGVHDKDDEIHTGFDALTVYAQRATPRLLIHGHQHVNRETRLGQTQVIGVFGHRLLTV